MNDPRNSQEELDWLTYAEEHDENYGSYEYWEDDEYEHYDPDELDPAYDGY